MRIGFFDFFPSHRSVIYQNNLCFRIVHAWSVADLRGARGWVSPWGSKFFQFHAVLGKILQNRMLAPPLEGWCPHLGEILDPPLLIYYFWNILLIPATTVNLYLTGWEFNHYRGPLHTYFSIFSEKKTYKVKNNFGIYGTKTFFLFYCKVVCPLDPPMSYLFI